jgi:hypothetical protein
MKTKLGLFISILLTNVFVVFSQGLPELPADPGIPVPLDAAVLVSLLLGGTVVGTLFIKRKNNKQ